MAMDKYGTAVKKVLMDKSSIIENNRKPSIAFLVPDGIGVRNYLYSSLPALFPNHQLILMHNLPSEVLAWIEEIHPNTFLYAQLPVLKESRTNDIWRRLLMFARLHLNSKLLNNPSIAINWFFWYTQRNKTKRRVFKWLDTIAALVSTLPSLFYFLEKTLYSRMLKAEAGIAAIQFLNEYKPQKILCTHQRSIEAGYVMTAANNLGIDTFTVIFSWDNLPKSRINFIANHYLVWSEYMQKELQLLYPFISNAQVHITGTPQFDHYYSDKEKWAYEYFCQYFDIEPCRPAICFSGNEPSFPSDHLYLKDICAAVLDANWENKPIILVRPSPNDHTERLQKVVSNFPGVAKIIPPKWKRLGNRDWESNYPKPEDDALLFNLTIHCKAVINIGSTMAIDFAHANKPAFYIRYNHPDCMDYDMTYGYEQDHFKTMHGLEAVVFVEKKEDWSRLFQLCIQHPHTIAKDRLIWKNKVTGNINNSSSLIAKAIL